MTQGNMLWDDLHVSMQRVAAWVDGAAALDLRYLHDLAEVMPDADMLSNLQNILTPLTDFLKDMLDELIDLLQKAFDALCWMFDQLKRLEILERFSSLLVQGMEVIQRMTSAVNTLSTTRWLSLDNFGVFMTGTRKIQEYMQSLARQAPDAAVRSAVLNSIGEISGALRQLRGQL